MFKLFKREDWKTLFEKQSRLFIDKCETHAKLSNDYSALRDKHVNLQIEILKKEGKEFRITPVTHHDGMVRFAVARLSNSWPYTEPQYHTFTHTESSVDALEVIKKLKTGEQFV